MLPLGVVTACPIPGPVGLCEPQVPAEEAQLQELGGSGPGRPEGEAWPHCGLGGAFRPPESYQGSGNLEEGKKPRGKGEVEAGRGHPGWRVLDGPAHAPLWKLHRVYSFLDYIMGGCQIHCTVSAALTHVTQPSRAWQPQTVHRAGGAHAPHPP